MEQYHQKINFTLPTEIKQTNAKKENNKLKEGENIKEIKSKIPNKKKKISSKSLYNGHNNLKFNLNIKTDETKISNQYSKICNKLEEEKKNLQSLNKIIKIHNNNIQTENNYYYSYKCNNSKNKNNQKKYLNKNLNLKKSAYNSIKRNKNFDNNSQILLDLNSNYNTNEDNKSFINIISKRKINDDNSKNKKLFNQYITVNQNNKNNRNNKNKKSANPKTFLETINRKIPNNNFIEKKALDLPNNEFNNFVINNENSIYEKVNNFEDNNDGDIKLIKINDLNKNIYKYDSSSTIHYSPNKFYHNIINYKQTNHYINIRNYNKYNNEQSIDNNYPRKIHKHKSETKSNNAFNNQYLYNKVSKNESCPRKRKKIMRNSSNEFNIYANMENTKYNTRTSIPLNYLLRNTINYMNSKEKKKDEKAFTVNELFRRDSIPKTLSINSIDYEPQATNPSIVPSKTKFTKKYFYQNTDNNIKIREGKSKDIQNDIKIFKKLKMPNNNNSEHIFRINRENQNHISINENSISNYNTEYVDNNYDINNTENIDIHYYKKKIYNISLPKTNTMDDLYSSNILNNLKPTGTLLSSKESYLDFNTMNKSRTNTNCSRKKIFVQKDKNSPQKKLSNSIVYKDKDNTSYETDFNYKYQKNDKMKIINRNNKINKDNFCYVKKNTTVLNEKDNNKLETNLIRMKETKYNFIIQNFNSDEKVLTSRSLKKNYKFNENEALVYNNNNTDEKVPSKGRIVYTKPLKYTSTSKTKTINNNFIKQNLNRKKYSLNNSIESLNNIENNFSTNYSKKPLHLKKVIKNNFNYILKTEKRKKVVKNEIEEKETNSNDKSKKKEIMSENSKKKEFSTYEENTDFSNYHVIDKSKMHCHYKKLYNYCIAIPIKKECYVEKVRNDKFEFNSFNEYLDKKDTLELKPENKNVTFNGKNIIPKIDNLKENINLKTNGSDEIININFESYGKNKNIYEVNRISPKNNNKNKTDYRASRIKITEEKTPNKDLYALLDNNNNDRNKFSNSTKDKFYKKDDLSRKLQICLATNKLSNIFITKKEKDDIPKRSSTTEEKFALGCSKLSNIFRRKSPPPNLMYKNLYLNEYQNIQIKKNNNMINESESSMEIVDNKINNKLSIMNKKSYTYIPKKRKKLSENNQNSIKNNNEDKDFEEEENIIKMKTQIINLLNIVNMNNLNKISGNISDIILFYDCKNMNISKKKISQKYMDNENIFISAIFNKIIFGKCDLSLYAQLCKKINLFVFKEIKNRTNINREENLFDKMIKEYYKRLYNKDYYNNINSDNAKELNIVQKKFIYLTNFISELILCKLVKKNESVQLIKELYNEYEKYDNNIKFIFLKGSALLLESLLEIIFQYQNCDDVLLNLENFIKYQLNNAINDQNISNDLKNKVYEIIEKFNEFKEPIIDNKNKNINDVNDNYVSQSNIIEKENDKLSINNSNNNNNNIMTFKNNYYQEENGGKDINKISETQSLVDKIKNNNSEKIGYKFNIIEENENTQNNQNANDYNIKKNLFEIKNDENNFENKSEVSVKLNNKRLAYANNSSNRKKKSKTKKKCKSTDKIKKISNTINDIIDNNKIYELVSKDFDNYLEFLKNERIKIKNDFYVEINDKYNWKEIDDLIMIKKVKLEEIIKTFIKIIKNRKDINQNDIFKAIEYIKALIEYYTNNLSNNQIEIFHLYMIETFMDINNIVENDDREIMHEIMGNLLFILLKNKLYYIKDLNNFIDKTEETKINIAKVVKYTIIASGNFSKQYHNDFKYTKLFNNSDLFVNYVTNELGDINKK